MEVASTVETGIDGVLVVEDRLDDARAREADGVVRRALALDDLVGGIPHVDGDLVELVLRHARGVRGVSQSRIGTVPIVASDHSGNSVSPCSPTM